MDSHMCVVFEKDWADEFHVRGCKLFTPGEYAQTAAYRGLV